MKKICIITGTRAEYGLLKPIINKIKQDNQLELQIIATGMHMSPEFGLTYKEIENDGTYINEKIEILLSSDSAVGISKSMGLAMIGFSECFQRLNPDMIIALGDRYEIFSAVSAATVTKIPVVHLCGGETTEGAFDEAFRHCITKMSYLHFTATEEYRQRVIQLGEDPSRVFNVGAIGVENIKTLTLLSKEEVENSINFKLGEKFVLATYHPVTLESNTSEEQFRNLLDALDEFKDLKIIFTKANSDNDGRIINKMIEDYANKNKEKAIAFASMGQLKYLSAMKYCSAVVGNSSSGIVEAPSLKVPTVNIGDRQKGRIQAESTINCDTQKENIKKALTQALSKEFREKSKTIINLYGEGNVSDKVITEIKRAIYNNINLKKSFYDIKR